MIVQNSWQVAQQQKIKYTMQKMKQYYSITIEVGYTYDITFPRRTRFELHFKQKKLLICFFVFDEILLIYYLPHITISY
jgi:hypothetical protein